MEAMNVHRNKPTFTTIVNAMTNWENTMWSREGYPGLRGKNINRLLSCAYAQPSFRRVQAKSAVGGLFHEGTEDDGYGGHP